MEEIKFDKNKIAVETRVLKDITNNISATQFYDAVFNNLVLRIECDIFQRTIAEKQIIHFLDKPTFMDWLKGFLFNKRKTQRVKVNVQEILKHPPIIDDSRIIFYNAEKI